MAAATDSPAPPARPEGGVSGRPRDDARAQALLDAALELVQEFGYDKVSVEAIAARAHASKATVYRWWQGKGDLVVEAMQRRYSAPADVPDTGSLRGDLTALMTVMLQTMGSAEGSLLCGLATAAQCDPLLGEAMRGAFADKRRMSELVVSRAAARGELAPGTDPELIHQTAPALALHRLIFTGEPLDEAFCTFLVDSVLLPVLQASPSP